MDKQQRKDVRTHVSENVSELKTLREIKTKIANVIHETSTDSNEYIDRKFIKYCLQHAFTKIKSGGKSNSTSLEDLSRFLINLEDEVDFFENPSLLLRSQPHFNLLLSAAEKFDTKRRKFATNRAKSLFLPFVTKTSKSLRLARSPNQTVSSYILALIAYVTDFKTQFKQFLVSELINGHLPQETNSDWQEFAHRYRDDADKRTKIHNSVTDALNEQIREVGVPVGESQASLITTIHRLLTKLTVSKELDNDLHTLVVRKPILVLSQCLTEVEEFIRIDSTIAQVHFKATSVFYIDTCLESNIWHGKSIQVESGQIICVALNLHWDISGQHYDTQEQSKAKNADSPGENGANGKNGIAGESGGNVIMVAGEFIDISKLYICTNGGNGGHGQHGGDGANGLDGKNGSSMSFEEFQAHFKSPVRWNTNDCDALFNSVSYLRSNSLEFEYSASNVLEDGTLTERTELFIHRYYHCSGMLSSNCNFEYCFSQASVSRFVYVLIRGEKGTDGMPAGMGGVGGCSAKGGFPGHVELYDFSEKPYIKELPKLIASGGNAGKHGINGRNGIAGQPGKDGYDIGMIDHFRKRNPVYYTNDYFWIQDLDSHETGSAWCSKLNIYRKLVKRKPERSLARLVDAENDTSLSKNYIVALKKSAFDKTKIFSSGNKIAYTSQISGISSSELKFDQALARYTDSVQNLHEVIHTAAIHRDVPDCKFNSLGGLEKSFCNKANIHDQQEELNRVFYSCYDSATSREQQDLGERIKNYKVDQKALWKPCLQRLKSPQGSSSFFHAMYGKERFGVISIDLEKLHVIREEKVRHLYLYLTKNRMKLPENIRELLGAVIVKLHTHVLKDEIMLDEDISVPAELDNIMKENIELVPRSPSRVLKQKSPTSNCLYLEDILKLDSFYSFLKSLLENTKVVINEFEAKLLSAHENIALQLIEFQDKNQIHFPISKWFKSSENTRLLAIDGGSNYSSLIPIVKRDYTNVEEQLIHLGIYQRNSKVDNLFPRICIIKLREANEADEISAKYMFSEIIQASLNERDVFPLAHITLSEYPKNWIIEMCMLHIESCNKALVLQANFEQFETIQQQYRETLSEFPACILLHIANILKRNPDMYQNEFMDGLLKKNLEKLFKFRPFDSSIAYDELSATASVSQWHQQLWKLQCIASVSKCIPGLNWKIQTPAMSEIFYYYYMLADRLPLVQTFLTQCYQQFFTTCETSAFVSDINLALKRIHSGCWQLREETFAALADAPSLSEFNQAMNQRSRMDIKRNVNELYTIILNDASSNVCKKKLMSILNLDGPIHFSESRRVGDVKDWLQELRDDLKFEPFPNYCQTIHDAIQRIDCILNREFKHTFHDTQKLAILASLHNVKPAKPNFEDSVFPEDEMNILRKTHDTTLPPYNLLLQVKTGEGKSYIVLAVAIIKGIFGIRSDIVTSSIVLAQRDARKYKKVYEEFGLTVGDVTVEDPLQRTEEYKKTVVYGEVAQLQRDYLLDHFYNQNLRGDRKFESLIVDEVDSMFLDKGNNVLYLTHQPASLAELERVFLAIWLSTVQTLNKGTYNPTQIFDSILATTVPCLSKEDLKKTGVAEKLWQTCLSLNVINEHGILTQNAASIVNDSRDAVFQSPEVRQVVICFINNAIKTHNEKKRFTKRLENFVMLHLLNWIKSAHIATQLEEGVEYVLHVDRFLPENDKYEKIRIIDLETGTDLVDSQWGEGLHQFLQLKHGCKLTPVSLKSVYISNISYFNMYSQMLGLTGTLGSKMERPFLEETYKVSFLRVPTAFPKNFTDEEPIVCQNHEMWLDQITNDVKVKIKDNRAVLLICEHIQHVNEMKRHLTANVRNTDIVTYRRDSDECDLTSSKKELEPRTIIISTNLAGRGTDIKLSNVLQKNGGLHVVLTFLPCNSRIRWQGMGRAARCGDPGSGRLIFKIPEGASKDCSVYTAVDYVNEKDEEEVRRVTQVWNLYNDVIVHEENQFSKFSRIFEDVRRVLDIVYSKYNKDGEGLLRGKTQNLKDVVLHSLLTDWAFWLDKYTYHLRTTKPKRNDSAAENELHKFEESCLNSDFNQLILNYKKIEEISQNTSFFNQSMVDMGFKESDIDKHVYSLVTDECLQIKLANIFLSAGHYNKANTLLPDSLCHLDSLAGATARYFKLQKQIHLREDYEKLGPEIGLLCDWFTKFYTKQLEVPQSLVCCDRVYKQRVKISEGLFAQKIATCVLILKYVGSLSELAGKSNVESGDFADLLDKDEQMSKMLFQILLDVNILHSVMPADISDVEQNLNKLAMKQNGSFKTREQTEVCHVELDERHGKWPSTLSKSELEMETHFDAPTSSGFLAEIQDSILDTEAIILLEGKWNGVKVNEIAEWMEAQKQHFDNVLFVSTRNIEPQHFSGSILRASNYIDNVQLAILLHDRKVELEMVVAVNIHKLKQIPFQNYFRVNQTSFESIPCFDRNTSSLLFNDFVKFGVLNCSGTLLTTDIIRHTDSQTSLFHYLSEELQNLAVKVIQVQCSYQNERLRLLAMHQANPVETLTLDFQKNSYSRFLQDAYKYKLIEGVVVNPARLKENPNAHVKLSTSFIGKLKKVFAASKITYQELSVIFPFAGVEMRNKIRNILLRYHIIGNDGIVKINNDQIKKQSSQASISDALVIDKVLCYLEVVSALKEPKFKIELNMRLHILRGSLNIKNYTHRSDSLSSANIKNFDTSPELRQQHSFLQAVGLESIIISNYSNRAPTVGLIFLGTGQILLGSLAQKSFIGVTLGRHVVWSGIQDILYGIRSFRKGYLRWYDWGVEKTKYIIVTAGTYGVGKLTKFFLRGTVPTSSLRIQAGVLADSLTFTKALEKAGEELFMCLLTEEVFANILLSRIDKFINQFIDKAIENVINNIEKACIEHEIICTLFRRLAEEQGIDNSQAKIKKLSNQAANSILEAPSEFLNIFNRLKPFLKDGINSLTETISKQIISSCDLGAFTIAIDITISALLTTVANEMIYRAEQALQFQKLNHCITEYLNSLSVTIQENLKYQNYQVVLGMNSQLDIQPLVKICKAEFEKSLKLAVYGEMHEKFVKSLMDEINRICTQKQTRAKKKLQGPVAAQEMQNDTGELIHYAEMEIHRRNLLPFERSNECRT